MRDCKCGCAHVWDCKEQWPDGLHKGISQPYGWKCSLCGDWKPDWYFKLCQVCRKGIDGPVKYSQHYHDACAPEHTTVGVTKDA